MCDTYVDGIGYVCRECQAEFKDYLEQNGIVVKTEGEIYRALKTFMESEKDSHKQGVEMTVGEFFSSYSH